MCSYTSPLAIPEIIILEKHTEQPLLSSPLDNRRPVQSASAVGEAPMVASESHRHFLFLPGSHHLAHRIALVVAVDVQVFNRCVSDALANGSVIGLIPRATLAPTLEFAMGDWFSLSVLQILSIVSFVTSLFAVARAGSVTLGRWQHKFEANIQQPAANVAASVKVPMWSWKVSGLPVSFSLGSILGEDEEQDEGKDSMVGYHGGSMLVRMDWQLSRPATGSCPLRGRDVQPIQIV